MKHSLKKLLLNEGFVEELQAHPDWQEGVDMYQDKAGALNRAKAASELWKQHADMNFVNSLVFVHFTPGITSLVQSADTSNMLSCTVIDGSGNLPEYEDYGDLGAVITGDVVLLFNDADSAYTGFNDDFDGDRGLFLANADNIATDKSTWKPSWMPEALVKNFRVVALTGDANEMNLERIQKYYEKKGISLPVVDINDPELMKFSNSASRR